MMASEAARRPPLWRWVVEGARSAVLRRPRWDGLRLNPARMTLLVALSVAASIGLVRLYFPGDAVFNPRAGFLTAVSALLMAWVCYVLRPNPTLHSANPRLAPSAPHLFTMVYVQGMWLMIFTSLISIPLIRANALAGASTWIQWASWLLPTCWLLLAELTLLLRTGDRRWGPRIIVLAALAANTAAMVHFGANASFWYAPAPTNIEVEEEPLRFTQQLIEEQAPLLEEELAALAPQRPGIADMYTLTFAPYEGEEVFRRESRMVSDVMAKRFDAAGRGLQLLNHRAHLEDMAWATPVNLQRAIEGIAGVMNREEDILFIHLTSHGARDGELAANFWPLDPESVTPPELRKWLDDAGIKHRVISISACFSGSWIASLASEDTLVMTASDADHTSYGCGKKSPLTFFGRAMYDEQLRSKTLSFEQAHAASRKIIEQREKEAGKDDGYSNPQIKMGTRIKSHLDRMRTRLESK